MAEEQQAAEKRTEGKRKRRFRGLKIVLGLRNFLLYWVFVIVFALMTGLAVNLIL